MTGGSGQGGIAIVGLAGRFPGAADTSQLWANLAGGVESVRALTDEELERAGVPRAVWSRPDYVKACAFLEDPDGFDAPFFEVTPREAEILDPQQRVFLECAWSAFEDAGYDVARVRGSVGVFAGAGKNHYFVNNLLRRPDLLEAMGPVATTIASEKDFVATRVSYKLDLGGPSVAVQTACSTSLVAVHLACQSLLAFECDLALAGGVSISSYRPEGYPYLAGGIFSSDGHLRAFDARADGQVGGNGAAAVVLKRLEDALADGDTIRAVVLGSALNNDGMRKVSFNAPAVDGQARVVAEALEVAGVEAESIGYVECHGTGTHLGDPIEVAALTQAFRCGTGATDAVGFCGIGSLKTNIGHLDAAAGAAGLVKAALALQHECIPPSLHFETPNPELSLETSPFFVTAEALPWKRGERPRRAGVSSFGMGGTNAHVVLEEAPLVEPGDPARRAPLLVLSARSEAALERASERLADHLEATPDVALADVAHTLQTGRRAFAVRRALCGTLNDADRAEVVAVLRRTGDATRLRVQALERGRTVAFLFSGQGSQHANMTRGLYESEPVFRAEVDRCCELLGEPLGRDLRELLYPAPGEEESAGEALTQTALTQPALFVVEYALARLLAALGLEPAEMLGHSVGEYVAATLAGVFELPAALELVAARGRLIGSLPAGGGMLSVPLSEEDVLPYLVDGTSVAVVNAPRMCVVAGPRAALEAVRTALRSERIAATPVHTSHAFHSALMDPILGEFEACVRKARPRAPRLAIRSCTTGERLTEAQAADPTYWVRHLREPVRFGAGAQALHAAGHALLEVGPGQALTQMARLCVPEDGTDAAVVPCARHPRRDDDDARVLVGALGALWCAGVRVDWDALRGAERRLRVPLPTYPFEHRRYWAEPGAGDASAASRGRRPDPASWFWVPSWRRGATPGGGGFELPKSVLLLADEGGLADSLAERLRRAGTRVLVARPGDALGGELPRSIVHLGVVDPCPVSSADALGPALDRAFYGPLELVQALEERGREGTVVQFVTRGMQDVLGEPIEPEKALLAGVCKAARAECSRVTCRSIDLDAGAEVAASAEALVAELFGGTEPVVALRGGRRWLPDVEPVRLERLAAPIPSPHPPGEDARGAGWLREKASVLITGGYGGVGLALAEALAGACRARLALLGRTALPVRDAWDAWLAEHGEDDPVSAAVRAVQRIEGAGGEVLLLRGDVTSRVDVAEAVRAIEARFGRLDGVVHAAGRPGAGLLALKTRQAAAEVLAPKVAATRVLADELGGRELDFLVLCSSLATALDGVGQVDYFAANAFLDAFARARAGCCPGAAGGPAVVSVGWEAWRDVGMAAGTDVPEALRRGREEALRTGLSRAEGGDVLLRVLAAGQAHVLVSTRELGTRVAEAAREAQARGDDERCVLGTTLHERPDLVIAYVEPSTGTERHIATLWGELLGIEGIGAHDDFFELGGNSLLLMQVSARLGAELDVSLTMRDLFETTTVTALSERIDSLRLIGSMERGGGDSPAEQEELRL